MKDSLISTLVLALPRSEGKYTLDSGTCDKQIDCVLLKEQQDGNNRPVGYWSRTLTDKKPELAAKHKERLAVVYIATLLHPYFEGTRFIVRMDHEALRRILTMADATGKLIRWRSGPSECKFDFWHRTEMKHQSADELTLRKRREGDTSPLQHELSVLTVSLSYDRESTPHGDTVYEFIEETQTFSTPSLIKVLGLADKADNYKLDDRTLKDFIRKQSKNVDFRVAFSSIGQPNYRFTVGADGVLVRVSPLDDGS